MSKNISIIGPAKGDKFSKELYTKMVMKAYGIILNIQGIKPEDVNLVSGGSAWSDHVAVSLFTSEIFKSCKLYLPCPLVKLNGQYQFKDTGEYSWKTNSGRVLNFYHGKAISDIALRQYRETLGYYGFDYHKLLIKSFTPPSKQISNPSMLTIDFDDTIGEPNILLFGDQADFIECLTKINKEELPYIPFTVIMAEGKLTYGGEMSDTDPTDIQMNPVFASFTENRNIMFIQNIMGKSVETSEGYYGPNFQCQEFEKIKIGSRFIGVSEDQFNDNDYEDANLNNSEEPLYLKILNTDYTLEGKLINYDLNVTTDISNENLIKLITNREFEHEFVKADPGVIDSDAIIKRVEEVKLYDKIKKNMNNILISNSQRIADSQDEFYCNENVYGNFNLIFIYGFISI